MISASDDRRDDKLPVPSALVALEVALLSSAEHHVPSDVSVALVVAPDDDARLVVRHLPAVAAVLLSDDASVPEAVDASRLAPIVVLRGAFRAARLLEVVATLIGEGEHPD